MIVRKQATPVQMVLVQLFVQRGIIAQMLGAVLMERSAQGSQLASTPQIPNAQITLLAVRKEIPYVK